MRIHLHALLGIALLLAGCAKKEQQSHQGYLEGEFVYAAAPLGGRLENLFVQKGARVDAGGPLFSLEMAAETAARQEAGERLRSARARLEDLRKGLRPEEIDVLQARLEQARASAELTGLERVRQDELFKKNVAALGDYDRARLADERARWTVGELTAQIATSRLGARSDAISAAEAEASAAEATLERAAWSVAQKTQSAPQAGLVYDTVFRVGEFVGAGQPVVVLLPPENLKVRFFVPESVYSGMKPGDRVRVGISGRSDEPEAVITYLSPSPEFTPPVLYNRDNRAKLVFMVEAVFNGKIARDLHPGQPVDVMQVR